MFSNMEGNTGEEEPKELNIFISRLRDQVGWSRQRATLFVTDLAVCVIWTAMCAFLFFVITSIKNRKWVWKASPKVLWWLLNRNKARHVCLLVHAAGPPWARFLPRVGGTGYVLLAIVTTQGRGGWLNSSVSYVTKQRRRPSRFFVFFFFNGWFHFSWNRINLMVTVS